MIQVIVATCALCKRQFFMRYNSDTHTATPSELIDMHTGEITECSCGCGME